MIEVFLVAFAAEPMRSVRSSDWVDVHGNTWSDAARQRVLEATVDLRGCSGVVLSERGLVLTTRSCIAEHLGEAEESGFVAATVADERALEGQRASLLFADVDITREVLSMPRAVGSGIVEGFAHNARAVEKEYERTALRTETLGARFRGGFGHSIQEYRYIHEIRLVAVSPASLLEPQWPAGFRDLALVRLYDDGEAVRTRPLSLAPAVEDPSATVVLAHQPGATERYSAPPTLRGERALLEARLAALKARREAAPPEVRGYLDTSIDRLLTYSLPAFDDAVAAAERASGLDPSETAEAEVAVAAAWEQARPQLVGLAAISASVLEQALVRQFGTAVSAVLDELEDEDFDLGSSSWERRSGYLRRAVDRVEASGIGPACQELGAGLAHARSVGPLPEPLQGTVLAAGTDQASSALACEQAWASSLLGNAKKRDAFLARPNAKKLQKDDFAAMMLAMDTLRTQVGREWDALQEPLRDPELVWAVGAYRAGYDVGPGGGSFRMSVGELVSQPKAELPEAPAWAEPAPQYVRARLDFVGESVGGPLLDGQSRVLGLLARPWPGTKSAYFVPQPEASGIVELVVDLPELLEAVGGSRIRAEIAEASPAP